jgi:hypothetical protein
MFRPVSHVMLLALLNTCQKLPLAQLRQFSRLEPTYFDTELAKLLACGVVFQQRGVYSLAREVSSMARLEGAVN